jgi:hypothetical protein
MDAKVYIGGSMKYDGLNGALPSERVPSEDLRRDSITGEVIDAPGCVVASSDSVKKEDPKPEISDSGVHRRWFKTERLA